MQNWAVFNGWCITHGVRPLRLHYADFCDVVYYWLSRNSDEDGQAKLDEMIGAPPAGDTSGAETPGWSREEQMAAFNSW